MQTPICVPKQALYSRVRDASGTRSGFVEGACPQTRGGDGSTERPPSVRGDSAHAQSPRGGPDAQVDRGSRKFSQAARAMTTALGNAVRRPHPSIRKKRGGFAPPRAPAHTAAAPPSPAARGHRARAL